MARKKACLNKFIDNVYLISIALKRTATHQGYWKERQKRQSHKNKHIIIYQDVKKFYLNKFFFLLKLVWHSVMTVEHSIDL